MSGPQHIRWFEIAQRAIGHKTAAALQVRMARSENFFDAQQMLEALLAMSGRRRSEDGG